MTTGASDWRSTGNTTRQAFRVAIARSWTAEPSPMRVEADALYDALRPFGLTRLAAAMAWAETKNFSWNCATAPAGKPCIPLSCRNPWAMKANAGLSWAQYESFEQAARDWADRLLSPNGPYRQTATVKDLAHIYAPPFENDTAAYITTVCKEIDALPLEGEGEMANPFPVPTIHELSEDYLKYGLTKAQADKIRNHRFVGRNGRKPQAIFLHIQEGTNAGSLSWWASGNADASSTVLIGRDGTVLRVIPEQDGPWTNGDVLSPTPKGQRLVQRIGGVNPNLVTLSIEAEGYWQERPTEAQVNAICWQVSLWLEKYKLVLDRDVYRHADVNQQTRANCPGTYYEIVMERLRKGSEPAPPPKPAWPEKPEWLDADAIPFLFPEANPDGIRTQAWLRYCNEVGRAPARKAFIFKGESRELICFDDGTMIDLLGQVVGKR